MEFYYTRELSEKAAVCHGTNSNIFFTFSKKSQVLESDIVLFHLSIFGEWQLCLFLKFLVYFT